MADDRRPKRIIDWPYETCPNCGKLANKQTKCAKACTAFVSPIRERLCGLCGKKHNCNCLKGEGRRKMCQHQTKSAEDGGAGREKTDTVSNSPTTDDPDSDGLTGLLRDIQLLEKSVRDKYEELNESGSKLSAAEQLCLDRSYLMYQMYRRNEKCPQNMVSGVTRNKDYLQTTIKFLKRIQTRLERIRLESETKP